MEFEECKDCEYNHPLYGCINQDCEIYQDIKAEAEFEMRRDEFEDVI